MSGSSVTNRIPATIPAITVSRQFRAFTGHPDHGGGAPVRGNPCLVHLAESAPIAKPARASHTQCVTWTASGRAYVRCWTGCGSEIELCGHGLLCCAGLWRSVGREQSRLAMNGVEVQCESRGALDWVAFPTAAVQDCAAPDWAATLLGAAPERAASAGPESGYLVLEMSPGCDLTDLAAPGDALPALSTRSVIVTRRVAGQDALLGETIQYRYFAPQFGVPEDTATGSAMRVLAAFWQLRGAGDEQKALQRSKEGGWLESRIEGERTWIGGRVEAEATA